MLCLLKDADSNEQKGDELIRNWVSEIRDVAYDSEDFFDTFVLKVTSRERGSIMNLLIKSSCILNKIKHQYKKLQRQLRRPYPHVENEDVIGLEEYTGLKGIEDKNEEDLVQLSYKYLQDKRYLVVLDDIWSSEAWDILSLAFPYGVKGSKVLLTTCNKEVTLHADS
ncbi:hypothetical protein C5167_037760 [Papaver somniferum]|uniref:NB-ARC domain-containing protein n=1 Tax=Papaver somniferum TaxID=3469 RepID=A0A4Y7IAY8_PAPSO|nr:hypothetical protein C5167_037760 [Papaver somniferum]